MAGVNFILKKLLATSLSRQAGIFILERQILIQEDAFKVTSQPM